MANQYLLASMSRIDGLLPVAIAHLGLPVVIIATGCYGRTLFSDQMRHASAVWAQMNLALCACAETMLWSSRGRRWTILPYLLEAVA